MNLNVYQSKIDCYRYGIIYINFVVTRNKKPIKVTQRIKRKESKQNIKEIHKITMKEIKRRREEQRRTTKTTKEN